MWRDWSISTLGGKIWAIPTIQQDDHCVSWYDVTWLIDFHPGRRDLIDSYHSAGWSLCVMTWRDVTDRFPPWVERSDRTLPFRRMIIACFDMTWRDWSISTLGRKIWSIPTIQQEDHCVSWRDVTDRFLPWAERSDQFLPFRRKIIMCRDMMWRDWSISTLGRKIWSIPTIQQEDHCVLWCDFLCDFEIVCLCWMIFFWMDRHFLQIRCKISTETVSGGNAAAAYLIVICWNNFLLVLRWIVWLDGQFWQIRRKISTESVSRGILIPIICAFSIRKYGSSLRAAGAPLFI
jgi:hypothetical protein